VSEIRKLLTIFVWNNRPYPVVVAPKHPSRGFIVSDVSTDVKDEKVLVTRNNFNVANVIAAIALLLLVLGLLKWMGVSPF
jgi:hypothetical protein